METLKYLLFFLSFLWTSSIAAQNNIKYSLNDPRNPLCPCHKLQKLAEDQYSREIKGSRTFERNNDKKVKRIFKEKRKSLYKKSIKINNVKSGYKRRNLRKNKARTDYSVCYKW
jgi:hypothetical protein